MLLFGNKEEIKKISYKLRQEVFIKEQHIPEKLEFDEVPEKNYFYLIYLNKKQPVATIRLEIINKQLAPDRLCVLKKYRHQGIGTLLLKKSEEKGKEFGLEKAFLYGEITATSFYLKNGWKTEEKVLLIDTIPCFLFEKNL